MHVGPRGAVGKDADETCDAAFRSALGHGPHVAACQFARQHRQTGPMMFGYLYEHPSCVKKVGAKGPLGFECDG